jgi:hypothetical protein
MGTEGTTLGKESVQYQVKTDRKNDRMNELG